jgi:hypothetical protein
MASGNPAGDKTEHLWILLLCVAAVLFSFALEPAQDGSLCFYIPGIGAVVSLPSMCMSSRLLGISCPGCGLTRSFVAVAHGEFLLALQMNFMGPVLFFLACSQIPYRIVEYLGILSGHRGWEQIRRRQSPVMWIVLAGMVANWIWRMI